MYEEGRWYPLLASAFDLQNWYRQLGRPCDYVLPVCHGRRFSATAYVLIAALPKSHGIREQSDLLCSRAALGIKMRLCLAVWRMLTKKTVTKPDHEYSR